MAITIPLKADAKLGVVPTHLKFVGGLVPDDDGRLPRGEDGKLLTVSEMAAILETSPAPVHMVQIPVFPGVHEGDMEEQINALRELGLEVHIILMVGGADPLNPDDEAAVVDMLASGLQVAKKFGIAHVSSTSFEEWMSGRPTAEGAAYDQAVAQLAKVHHGAYQKAGVAGSCIQHWHLEFLRSGEFTTFTSIAQAAPVVTATNALIGETFMQLMVDAAHCGDSGLSIPENEALINDLAERDEFGIFHASAKTTRGCLSTDDGWVGALLAAGARSGKLDNVFVELFHHEDPALEALRDLDPGHGIDTTDGRSYTQATVDGLVDVTRRLNNLAARGMLG